MSAPPPLSRLEALAPPLSRLEALAKPISSIILTCLNEREHAAVARTCTLLRDACKSPSAWPIRQLAQGYINGQSYTNYRCDWVRAERLLRRFAADSAEASRFLAVLQLERCEFARTGGRDLWDEAITLLRAANARGDWWSRFLLLQLQGLLERKLNDELHAELIGFKPEIERLAATGDALATTMLSGLIFCHEDPAERLSVLARYMHFNAASVKHRSAVIQQPPDKQALKALAERNYPRGIIDYVYHEDPQCRSAGLLEMLDSAVAQGLMRARVHAGWLYYHVRSSIHNKGLKLFDDAAKDGSASAMLYRANIAFDQMRYPMAMDMLQAAATLGHADSAFRLASVLFPGSFSQKQDCPRALELLKQAALLGHKGAQDSMTAWSWPSSMSAGVEAAVKEVKDTEAAAVERKAIARKKYLALEKAQQDTLDKLVLLSPTSALVLSPTSSALVRSPSGMQQLLPAAAAASAAASPTAAGSPSAAASPQSAGAGAGAGAAAAAASPVRSPSGAKLESKRQVLSPLAGKDKKR